MKHLQPPTPGHEQVPQPAKSEMLAALDRYDIAVSLIAVYEWGSYRYSNANDAIAAAKRGSTTTR